MKTRTATKDDIPAVTDVILAAINNDRLWAKFVPSKTTQDDAYVQEIVKLLLEHADSANKDWEVQVVDLASSKSSKDKGDASEIVAVAVWDVSSMADTKETKPPTVHTDLSDSRTQAVVSLLKQAKTDCFKDYPQHRYLQLLATHPRHQNQGYATDLVKAGMAEAKKTGGVLTAVAGPLGYILFSGFGFHDIGSVTLPPSSATDTQAVKAMVLVVPKEERRRSFVDSLIDYVSN
ncbi:uncharacterized protein J7T54_007118 [Emericellopsis cladophorae]|uniref:N-acetyltransferase domain-containing protein n=1 Tax=Emericellopsis cladophorae TaxID=2686198 RepID=A0A9P9Y9I3_9HYPO|nr:uncharacterized protein J7T54_007118 [Emericellopsis cladophorae]KAI6785475.1 hypothetical protein J7T54_007118 [Emericellopsis cladophorae]